MSLQKYINEVLKKFYLLTHVPIQSINYEGKSIGDVGYSRSHEHFFHNYNIYSRIIAERKKEENYLITTVSCVDYVHFTATPICPRNKYRGLFVMGPYSSRKNNSYNLVYKPLDIAPYLVRTVAFIWRDFPNKKLHYIQNNIYNLHIRKAIDYIDSRYMYDIKLEDLSNYLNINKSYFSSLFKKETGETFTEYLNKIRIEKSKALLLDSTKSILDIALAVGFSNQNYYNIMFKKITGMTPLEFRNKNS